MDYERKERNITYSSPACKMYLRHDFGHTCAYCGIVEETVSVFPEIAEKYFEKDHFLPQKDELPERHQYPNLFYACKKCNGMKDALILSLNPCVDNIYSGQAPHVWGGTEETGFVVKASTPEGQRFIDVLELNSRYHVSIREKQKDCLEKHYEARKIIGELRKDGRIDDATMQVIEEGMYPVTTVEDVKYLCGTSKFGLSFVEAYNYLSTKGYGCEIIFESNELDMIVTIGEVCYWGQLLESNEAVGCRLRVDKLKKWKEKGVPCGAFRYVPSDKVVRFYKIDFDNIDWNKALYSIKEYDEL